MLTLPRLSSPLQRLSLVSVRLLHTSPVSGAKRWKEKTRADKLEREKQPLTSRLEQLEADLKHALKMSDNTSDKMGKDIVMFNQEISRLTKERDTGKGG